MGNSHRLARACGAGGGRIGGVSAPRCRPGATPRPSVPNQAPITGHGQTAPLRGAAIESLCKHSARGSLKRIAPIFAVRDLGVAMAHFERLGFATRAYHGGGYGFATRDGIEIHL